MPPTTRSCARRAACAHDELFGWIEQLAYASIGRPRGLALYQLLLSRTPPASGPARTSWLQSANNALIITHREKMYAESARIADILVAYATENPFITHAAACSFAAVGRDDDALLQVRRAVELGYPHLDKLRTDTDLGPLLSRPDFQALFAKPARSTSKRR